MQRRSRCVLLGLMGPAALLAFSTLGGCTSPARDASWPEPRALGRDLATIRPSVAPGVPESAYTTPANPTGGLTLRDALALALERNPDLAAFSWEVRASEARTLQAGLPPNPELSLETENVAGTGEFRRFGAAETTLALGQLVETWGKRAKRRRVAALEQNLAGWGYEARRIDVFTSVTQAFVAVLAAQESLGLSEELLKIARDALTSVGIRVREGAASPVEQTRAEVAVSAARVERDQRRAEIAVARVRLAEFWGSHDPTFSEVVGDLFTYPPPPDVDDLMALVDENPELARWSQEIARRRALVDLADARGVPDVTVGAGYRHFSGTNDDALLFEVAVPLPVFDRNQGRRLAVRYELARAREERRAAEARVRSALRAAHLDLMAAHQRMTTLRMETLAAAESSYQQTLDAYRRGLFRYLDVLDAQRTLFGLRANYIAALRAYHFAVAELERLTGAPL